MSQAKEVDVLVIGGGPGGYVAAIRASQLGFKVACVDKRETLGGTCLNVGCIPSKALLQSSEKYYELKHGLSQHGITAHNVSLDLAAMMGRKNKVVRDLTQGILYLFKKHNVEHMHGTARIIGLNEVEITGAHGRSLVRAKNIIIATGSEPATLPGIKIDEKKILSSTQALDLSSVPQKMLVVGGGYIGLEMGSVWQRLGTEVTVVEYFSQLIPNMDHEIGLHLQKSLTKQGLNIRLSSQVKQINTDDKKVKVVIQPLKDGAAMETIECDVVLMSVGRRPYTMDLGLEEVGVALDEKGFIVINEQWRTSVPNIFAIGDVVRGPMLAHKAEDEGVVVAEIIAGQSGHVDYNLIPAVIYTMPEVASVGKTEHQLKQEQINYKVGKFPFSANSRARATGDTDGFVKILTAKDTDEILGVHIIASNAGTMIAEAVVAMEFKAAAEDLARISHAHPTWNEAVKEAALAVDQRAIHI